MKTCIVCRHRRRKRVVSVDMLRVAHVRVVRQNGVRVVRHVRIVRRNPVDIILLLAVAAAAPGPALFLLLRLLGGAHGGDVGGPVLAEPVDDGDRVDVADHCQLLGLHVHGDEVDACVDANEKLLDI